ncbi:putative uncharacterized oxidoreductase [Glarea lozoyensis 74030]|uniref:Uncharacterized oxidoreductase n=1 Tax=Glarea lozoyensis (strain ATCC 74030 / MF5533) TaxID=1104152 RepID=H0EXH9_GLAL7|nr:putative uncharacterized oxidoreductase [Glarea lozoyensis 74030]
MNNFDQTKPTSHSKKVFDSLANPVAMASINSGVGKTVLVTGGSGYVAAEVLNSFLIRGYNVKTTVRNEASAEKIKKSHAKYLDQLSFAIVKDLQLPGGHDEAVKGVDGVIHTASPFVLQVEDNARDLLEPAVNGTLEVLKSVQKNNPAVKRVVITSSFAAIIDIFQGPRPGYTYTEKDWNPTTYDVAANPSTPGGVSYYIYRLINGTSSSVPETSFFGFVDVRDLAEAHVRAYESEDAAGQRYITCSGGYTYQQICDVIRAEFPGKRDVVPEGNVGEKYPDVYVVDNGKIRRELGMEFRSLKTCVVDMVEQFIEYEKA